MKIKIEFAIYEGDFRLWKSESTNAAIAAICAKNNIGYSDVEYPTDETKVCTVEYTDELVHSNNILEVQYYTNSLGIKCRIVRWEVLHDDKIADVYRTALAEIYNHKQSFQHA